MKPYLIKITNDVLDVAAAIEGVSEGNYVVYNKKDMRYEVHNRFNRGNTLSLILPYKELDARAIDLVRKTARHNADALFAEMERHNEALRQAAQKAAVDAALSKWEGV